MKSRRPGGRPRRMQSALRAALLRTGPPAEPMTRIDRWAEDLVAKTTSTPDRLAVLAYIDGLRPDLPVNLETADKD